MLLKLTSDITIGRYIKSSINYAEKSGNNIKCFRFSLVFSIIINMCALWDLTERQKLLQNYRILTVHAVST